MLFGFPDGGAAVTYAGTFGSDQNVPLYPYTVASEEAATGLPGSRVFATSDTLGSTIMPVTANVSTRHTTYAVTPEGLEQVNVSTVLVGAGETVSQTATQLEFDEEDLPPQVKLTTAELLPGDIIKIRLTGEDFTAENPYPGVPDLGSNREDLFVQIASGPTDVVDKDGNVIEVRGGADVIVRGLEFDSNSIEFEVPAGTAIAGASIRLVRPMFVPSGGTLLDRLYKSNEVQFSAGGGLVFALNGGSNTVSVLNPAAMNKYKVKTDLGLEEKDKFSPEKIAQFSLQVGNAPRHIAFGNDGTRAFVTLESGGVAIIDPVLLSVIDVDPIVEGIQHIDLPAGSRPFESVVDPQGDYLFVSDAANSKIYVVDINRRSTRLYELIQTIDLSVAASSFTTTAIGLRGMAMTADGRDLYVAAPIRDVLQHDQTGTGHIVHLRFERDFDGTVESAAALDESGATRLPVVLPQPSIEVGPSPYDLQLVEDDKNLLVTDRVSGSKALANIARTDNAGAITHESPKYTSFVNFGLHRRVVEGNATHVFGVYNAQGVVYVPENTFKDEAGEHPAYAFVSGFNAYRSGAVAHDPSYGIFETYHVLATEKESDAAAAGSAFPPRTIGYPISAGGNIGIIRNPLGTQVTDWSKADKSESAMLVAATMPVVRGFPDNLALSLDNKVLLAGFQGVGDIREGAGLVFAYDVERMIKTVEAEADYSKSYPDYSQDPYRQELPADLNRLLRGPLSTIPIDMYDDKSVEDDGPVLRLAADFRYYDSKRPELYGTSCYGIPPYGPLVDTSTTTITVDPNEPCQYDADNEDKVNPFAPIVVGRLPRGLNTSPPATGELLSFDFTKAVEVEPTPLVREGEAAGLRVKLINFSRALEHSVSIDWGDGTQTTHRFAPGESERVLTHIYRDDIPSGSAEDEMTIDVTVREVRPLTGVAPDRFDASPATLLVQNVPPVVGSIEVSAAGNPVSLPIVLDNVTNTVDADLSVTISDPGLDDTFDVFWRIHSPNGGAQTFSLLNVDPTLPIEQSFTFTQAGPYLVEVRVVDDDTGQATAVTVVMVERAGTTPVFNTPVYGVTYDPAADRIAFATSQSIYGLVYPGLGDGIVYDHENAASNPDPELGTQVLPVETFIGERPVPAGSLLVFDGRGASEQLVALDAFGSKLADLDLGTRYALVGGVLEPVTGLVYLLTRSNEVVVIDPATGQAIHRWAAPFDVSVNAITTGDITLNPVTGNLLLGSSAEKVLYEVTTDGALVRSLDVSQRGLGSDLAGMTFDGQNRLVVSTASQFLVALDVPELLIEPGEGELTAFRAAAESESSSAAPTSPVGFEPLAAAVQQTSSAGLPVGLVNGDFSVSDPAAADFGWTWLGNVSIADSTATIRESVGMFSDLSQTFVVPAGTTQISFTVGGLQLDVGSGDVPPEAFEVAVLMAETSESITAEMIGLDQGDALLNIASDGTTRFAPGVTVEGVSTSGDPISDLSQSFRVTANLPAAASEAALTVYFDLIGFGDDASQVQVSNVSLDSTTFSWQNADWHYDVNDDLKVTARDALLIINELGWRKVSDAMDGTLVPITSLVHPPPYYDVNGNGRATALDALLVINAIARGEKRPADWQNQVLHEDISGNGTVTPLDVLLGINELGSHHVSDRDTHQLHEIDGNIHPPPYYDVNGDWKVTALDALMTLNYLRHEQAIREAASSADEILDSLARDPEVFDQS